MKYVFVAMAMLWAGAACAQGTRYDQGATLGGMSLELILPASLGLDNARGRIDLLNNSGNQSMAQASRMPIGIEVESSTRTAAPNTTYRFRILNEDQPNLTEFWDRHGGIPTFSPAVNICQNGPIRNGDRISYRLYRPGFGSTPMQHMNAAGIRDFRPCPTPR